MIPTPTHRVNCLDRRLFWHLGRWFVGLFWFTRNRRGSNILIYTIYTIHLNVITAVSRGFWATLFPGPHTIRAFVTFLFCGDVSTLRQDDCLRSCHTCQLFIPSHTEVSVFILSRWLFWHLGRRFVGLFLVHLGPSVVVALGPSVCWAVLVPWVPQGIPPY